MSRLWEAPVIAVLVILSFFLPANDTAAQDAPEFEETYRNVTRLRNDMRQDARKALLLLRRIEQQPASQQLKVKPVRTDVPVREAQLASARVIASARMDEEFPVLEKKDEWYRVTLADKRTGWVLESDVQRSGGVEPSERMSEGMEVMLGMVERLRNRVHARFDSAGPMLHSIDAVINRLSPADRQRHASKAAELQSMRVSIEEYVEYVEHFYAKHSSRTRVMTTDASLYPGPIHGSVGLALGSSSHNLTSGIESKQSLGSKRLDLNASMALSAQSNLTADLHHNNTIIQTPFSATDLKLGHHYVPSNGLTLRSHASINTFADEVLPRNDFTELSAGSALEYSIQPSMQLSSALNIHTKSFPEESADNFSGGNLASQLRVKNSDQSEMLFGLHGALQSSDISYLSFYRIAPQFQYRSGALSNKFSLKFEGELLGYSGDATANDYTREQIDLMWMTETTLRQFTVIAKQFPNNPIAGYIRAGALSRWSASSRDSYNRATVSFFYNFFPEKAARGSDYSELRLDQAARSSILYFDAHVYNRSWFNQSDSLLRDHVIDAVTRFGIVTEYGRIGPLLGAHILLREGEKTFVRDGNSYRLGIEAESRFTVSIVRASVNVRYEKNFVYGTELSIDQTTGVTRTGALRERHPTTFTFGGRAEIPVMARLDVTLDINTYDIRTDVDDAVSINPVAAKQQFNLLAGARYRFGP